MQGEWGAVDLLCNKASIIILNTTKYIMSINQISTSCLVWCDGGGGGGALHET